MSRIALPLRLLVCICLSAALPSMAQSPAASNVPSSVQSPLVPSTAASAPSIAPPPPSVSASAPSPGLQRPPRPLPVMPEPGEFERFVVGLNGNVPVARFGRELRRPGPAGGLASAPLDMPARVPADHVLRHGDEIQVVLWGSVDADWRARIDRSGRATLPRIGPVPLAGATAGELETRLRQRLDKVFKNYEISAAVTDLSPMQVYVIGFVDQPGAFVVPGATTLTTLIAQVQGPSSSGSFRDITLLRKDQPIASIDLYRLLKTGRRGADPLLQADDVVHIGPVGAQVAMLGSVNRPAIFEMRPGDTVQDLLELAGGFSTVADRRRLALMRVEDLDHGAVVELRMPASNTQPLVDGDVLRVFSSVDAQRPSQLRNKRVRVEGEVLRPGEFVLPPQATLADALAAAGGPSDVAYLFGAELRRDSVRREQEANYERALQELESEVGRQRSNDTSRDAEADNRAARQLLERLRARRPDGRVVLDVQPQSAALPAMPLEDGDRLIVPARTRSIGVYGSVYNSGSFVHDGSHNLGYYLGRAGGATVGADAQGTFVIRANGSVVSARQGGRWRGLTSFEELQALPGDTLFVPEDVHRVSVVQGAKDWTQVLYQFGLGVAGLLAIR